MQDTNPTPTNRKTYVLVRADLAPGAQLAQAIHAATELALAEPELCRSTPTVVVLSVRDEDHLLGFADALCGLVAPAHRIDAPYALFHEPDLIGSPGGASTALATICDGSQFAGLPLAGAAMA